jgi:hypothetical protein
MNIYRCLLRKERFFQSNRTLFPILMPYRSKRHQKSCHSRVIKLLQRRAQLKAELQSSLIAAPEYH